MSATGAEALLLRVTGRAQIVDALEWLAEGRALASPQPTHVLLEALTELAGDGSQSRRADLAGRALRAYARPALRSQLDPSVELLLVDTITSPSSYRAALNEVARHTTSGTLRDITVAALRAGQQIDPHVMETLCAVAGLTYRDLKDRVGQTKLPGDPQGTWTQAQAEAAFKVIDAIVRGTVSASSPAATAARPVELLMGRKNGPSGWAAVEELRSQGVPYELLLTQRVVGSAWGAHRNATAGKVQDSVATKLAALLEAREVPHRRLRRDGASRALLDELGLSGDGETDAAEGGRAGQVAFLVGAADEWSLAITVSVARDGGTANKSVGKLLGLPSLLSVPVAAVLVGPGWADRNETVELVRALRGRVFSDATLEDLADLAAAISVGNVGHHAPTTAAAAASTEEIPQ